VVCRQAYDVGLAHCGETYLLRAALRGAEVLCRDHCVTQVLSASRAAARCSSRPAITSASLFNEQCHEETARHAGHLDTARELLDGRTGLG
jgi:hypothetical protein